MDYTKLTLDITPNTEENREIIMAQLGMVGFESFVETDTGLEAFIQSECFNQEDFSIKSIMIDPTVTLDSSFDVIADQNWNEEWEKNYFQPIVIGGKCVVRAPFHTEYPKGDYEIVIEPNMAFGTGNHETTSTIMELILDLDLTGKQVLDMGCGTGILSILASMMGAEHITAIDIDKWSFEGTTENAALNNIQNITPKHGDASLLTEGNYDVIFANIHKNILIADVAKYASVLKSGGQLTMSGFYTEDIDDIVEAAKAVGLEASSYVSKNNWVAHLFTKP
ncbi:50S ribosomal protein L11 methyltransferase [Puteibacter caeruleilacunae]|nr:50S ribosomal protein L11 methyltransferase [Puteibacter caeruleilacunae]